MKHKTFTKTTAPLPKAEAVVGGPACGKTRQARASAIRRLLADESIQ